MRHSNSRSEEEDIRSNGVKHGRHAQSRHISVAPSLSNKLTVTYNYTLRGTLFCGALRSSLLAVVFKEFKLSCYSKETVKFSMYQVLW